jgi:hypothetical protein
LCAEFEAIDDSKKQLQKEKKKSKQKPKQPIFKQVEIDTTLENELTSAKMEFSDSSINTTTDVVSKHTCYTSEKFAKLAVLNIAKMNPQSSNCSSVDYKEKTKISINNEKKCQCDDETEFVHIINIDASILPTNSANNKCKMSCCFDIVDYWNKLVAEEEESKTWKKVKSRKVKLNMVEPFMCEDEHWITPEEKQHYFDNKSIYLEERMKRRQQLMEKWACLSCNLKLKTRITD